MPLPFVGQERGRPPPGGGGEGGIPDGHCTSYIVIVTPEGVFPSTFSFKFVDRLYYSALEFGSRPSELQL